MNGGHGGQLGQPYMEATVGMYTYTNSGGIALYVTVIPQTLQIESFIFDLQGSSFQSPLMNFDKLPRFKYRK